MRRLAFITLLISCLSLASHFATANSKEKGQFDKLIKKEVKKLVKDGWKTDPNGPSLEEQLAKECEMLCDSDEDGNPRYVTASFVCAGTTYEEARNQSIINAKKILAGSKRFETESKIQCSIVNSLETPQTDLWSLENIEIDIIPIVECYRWQGKDSCYVRVVLGCRFSGFDEPLKHTDVALAVPGKDYNGHEYVDLGLSVKWATCNVGASKPEDYGGYYQWAGTKDVSDKGINLDRNNCPYHTGADRNVGWMKYNTKSSYGTVDNKTTLELNDDAAFVSWGCGWRMPTKEEWTELRENCTWTWTTQNGVKGYKITSKKSGYINSSIFLPAAGCRYGNSLGNAGSGGCYWLSSLYADYTDFACDVYFDSNNIITDEVSVDLSYIIRSSSDRFYGQSIRPVTE